jgi:hypothetical protein
LLRFGRKEKAGKDVQALISGIASSCLVIESLAAMQILILLFAVIVFVAFVSVTELYLIKAFPDSIRLFRITGLIATMVGIGMGIFILVFTFMNVANG